MLNFACWLWEKKTYWYELHMNIEYTFAFLQNATLCSLSTIIDILLTVDSLSKPYLWHTEAIWSFIVWYSFSLSLSQFLFVCLFVCFVCLFLFLFPKEVDVVAILENSDSFSEIYYIPSLFCMEIMFKLYKLSSRLSIQSPDGVWGNNWEFHMWRDWMKDGIQPTRILEA